MNAQRERGVRIAAVDAASDSRAVDAASDSRAVDAASDSRAVDSASDSQAVDAAVGQMPAGRWLLAVSGGRDSMSLMDALVRARGREVAAVANFDHGTGAHAQAAARLVACEAERRGLRVILGQASSSLRSNESTWRQARHAFLDASARELGATVVTAHTHDDQVETVVQRLLRDAGPRGLAGMRAGATATTRRMRPLLDVPRVRLAAYARARGVPFVDDPSNATLAVQRNRIRHELLPALERAAPGFGRWCDGLSARAAAWRDELDALVESLRVTIPAAGTAVVPSAPLSTCGPREWSILWPAVAARAGVVMDRRGIERASEWAPRARAGQRIQLSGDAHINRTSRTFVVQGTTAAAPGYILDQ